MTPDSSARDAGDDDGEVAGYFIGQCGHPTPLVDRGAGFWVGLCDECESDAT